MKQVLLHIAICTFVAVSFCPEAIESCTMLSIAGKRLRRQAGPCQEGLALLARGLAGSAASLQEEAGQEEGVQEEAVQEEVAVRPPPRQAPARRTPRSSSAWARAGGAVQTSQRQRSARREAR